MTKYLDRFGREIKVGSDICFSLGQQQCPEIYVGTVTKIVETDGKPARIIASYRSFWGSESTRTIKEHQIGRNLIVVSELTN